jgi:hypothetical protein
VSSKKLTTSPTTIASAAAIPRMTVRFGMGTSVVIDLTPPS